MNNGNLLFFLFFLFLSSFILLSFPFLLSDVVYHLSVDIHHMKAV